MLSTFSIDSLLFFQFENKEERNILYAFLSAVVELQVRVWLMVIGEVIANIFNPSLSLSFKTDAWAVSVSFRF